MRETDDAHKKVYTLRKLLTNWILVCLQQFENAVCGASYLCSVSVAVVAVAIARKLLIHIWFDIYDRKMLTGKHTSVFRLYGRLFYTQITLVSKCRIFGACGIKRDKSSAYNYFAQYFQINEAKHNESTKQSVSFRFVYKQISIRANNKKDRSTQAQQASKG